MGQAAAVVGRMAAATRCGIVSDTNDLAESRLDRQVAWRAFSIVAAFFPAVAVINALSLITDAERAGRVFDGRSAFILELTSAAGLLAAFPLVVLFERRMPLTSQTWKRVLAGYVVVSIVFSVLHVLVMVLLREIVFGLLGPGYAFFDDVARDLLYEYRKDLTPYAAIVLVLSLTRRLEETRLEAAAARTDARDSGRLTLKSGGRTIWLDASAFDWAEAAGNYVEVRAGARTHLARISLSALAEQLNEASVDTARIHRSRLINRAKLSEIMPIGDGDFRVRMKDGTELRGSRRFRQEVG